MPGWANLLQKKLDVKPSRESNVINIGYSGADPAFAAAVANAFAQAYIDTNIELRVEPAKQYADWFDSQIKLQREKLEAAQKALSSYQQATGIVGTDERLDYETQKFNELSAQLTQAEAQGADASSKQKSGSADTLAGSDAEPADQPAQGGCRPAGIQAQGNVRQPWPEPSAVPARRSGAEPN